MNLRRSSLRLAAASVAILAGAPAFGQATTQPADPALAGAIAERLAFAADAASTDAAGDATLQAAGALIDLARRQKPDEIRFARAAADIWMRAGDRDRAVAALNAVRAIDPKDQLAMIQFVDLTLAGMETAEARQAYAQQIAGAASVPAEVRSHAALQLMNALSQRGMDGAALAALDQSLFLNPQNATALETRYRVLAQSGKPSDRVAAVMRLIEVAPNDARHVISLAQECSAAGEYDAAGMCYSLGFALVGSERQGPPPVDDLVDCVATQMLAGRPGDAVQTASAVIEAAPTQGQAYSAALLAQQLAGADDAALKPALDDARGVYLAQLAGLSQILRDPKTTAMPATRPAPPMPDVTGDVAMFVADDSRGLSTAYAVALSELLWFDLYFRAAPVDDAAINGLRTLIGDGDPLVVRFEGWRLLNAGSVDEAKVKFNAIADRDGFAKLGLAMAAQQQGDAPTAQRLAGEVRATRPTGLFGAQTAVACSRLNVPAPATQATLSEVGRTANAARDLIAQSLSAAREIYLMTADPSSVAYAFGEPMLAKLTLLNVGPRPIAIGPKGLIRPTFAIDTQTRGEGSRGFPATVVGRWAGAVRLASRQSTSQTVRIDRGPLDAFLRAYPTPVIALAAYVTTNPVNGPRGTTFSAGGQQAQVGGVFERRATPLHVEAFRGKLLDQLKKGAPAERVAAAEFVAAVLPELSKQSDNPTATAVRGQFQDALRAQAADETDATARAWIAGYASLGDPAALAKVASEGGEAGAVAALTIARTAPAWPTRQAVADAVLAASPAEANVADLARAMRSEPEPPAAPQAAPTPAPAPAP